MQGILVGLGNFGETWYEFLTSCTELDLTVVDRDEAKQEQVEPGIKFYTSLPKAIKKEEPDFIINATSPVEHSRVNRIAFDYQIPVLSEKPICLDYKEAQKMVAEASKQEVPFMVAKNYRQFPLVKKVKEYIKQGRIGKLKTINFEFRQDFTGKRSYLSQLSDPFLFEVGINHLDLLQFLTGREVTNIFAQSFSSAENEFIGNTDAYLILTLENEVMVNYTGSITSREAKTPWMGNWKIEGSKGLILLRDNKLCLLKNDEVRELQEFNSGLCLEECFDEFIFSLTEGKSTVLSAANYLKVQQLVELVQQSSQRGKSLLVRNEGQNLKQSKH
jgi:predicted dehydrogenase